jgi:hypothetical protein
MAVQTAMHVEAHGIWDWLRRFKVPGAVLRRCAKVACATAWDEWARGHGQGAQAGQLKDRFRYSAWTKYGFMGRSQSYMKWQTRVFGTILPYRSPRKSGPFQNTKHMADLIAVPAVGFRVRTTAIKGGVAARVTFPGGRILNIIKEPYGRYYRREFLQLTNSREGQAITHRALTLLWSLLRSEMRSRREAAGV